MIKRLRQSREWPSRWPIRWKLAGVSAGLTFVILVAFGVVVGQLTSAQVRDNYEADTKAAADKLVQDIRDTVRQTPLTPGYIPDSQIAKLLESASGPADVTVIGRGQTVRLKDAPDLGQLSSQRITEVGDYQVATVPYEDPPDSGVTIGFVRVARPIDRLQASVNRIWISVLAGTLGATLLAALAGVVLSRRAMRPISSLTTAAGEIARTRDPGVTLENPVTNDEVGELTRTFNEMLHELSLARSEREKALARQREFVADASHELRTPLTSVLANLELLEHSLSGPGHDLEQESVDSAIRSSQRMRRLVADLQILARADSGRTQPRSRCDLAEIADHAIEEVAPLSDEHRIDLEAPDPVVVEGTADELHRVVINLVDNAVRHTPKSSTITVSTGIDQASNEAVLTVADDGPGVPPELWPHIFDRFVRNAGPGDRTGSKGSGLGLAIVFAIAKAHNGVASVGDSAAGGAEFTVRLPLDPEQPKKPLAKL